MFSFIVRKYPLNVPVVMFPTRVFLEFVIFADLQSSSFMFPFTIVFRGFVLLMSRLDKLPAC
jgi:hypothetical protein